MTDNLLNVSPSLLGTLARPLDCLAFNRLEPPGTTKEVVHQIGFYLERGFSFQNHQYPLFKERFLLPLYNKGLTSPFTMDFVIFLQN